MKKIIMEFYEKYLNNELDEEVKDFIEELISQGVLRSKECSVEKN
jgi:hypothetical protein